MGFGLPAGENDRMDDLPRRAVTRTAKLATLPLGLAGRAALGFGKRVGGRPAQTVAAELQTRTADQLFRVLGELKGGAMKVGQALSVFEAALPEELAAPYRATLTRLQDAAPPLPARTVHQVLSDELGRDWRDRFRDFEDDPAAAASIGQVHRAVWADGRRVAVKIQYPGAAQALMSDFRQMSRVARVATSWVPGLEIKPILQELMDRVNDELDYELEAASQNRFAQAFRDDPSFVVPGVVTATARLIVSEWLEGEPLSRVIDSGSAEERDLAARRYMEFLLAGPGRAGLLHADPHPGNYRLTPDGRFGILDFGAVKQLPEGIPAQAGHLLSLALENDAQAVVAGMREEGFIKPNIVVEPAELLTYLAPFLEPVREETWRFSRAWLREVFAYINDVRRPEWSVGFKLNLPPEYLMIYRVWSSGVAVLCQIDGEVPVPEILGRWLPGYEPVGS